MLLPITVDPPERPIARDAHVDAAGAERLREVEGGFACGTPAHPHHHDRHDEQRDTDERDHRHAETLLRRFRHRGRFRHGGRSRRGRLRDADHGRPRARVVGEVVVVHCEHELAVGGGIDRRAVSDDERLARPDATDQCVAVEARHRPLVPCAGDRFALRSPGKAGGRHLIDRRLPEVDAAGRADVDIGARRQHDAGRDPARRRHDRHRHVVGWRILRSCCRHAHQRREHHAHRRGRNHRTPPSAPSIRLHFRLLASPMRRPHRAAAQPMIVWVRAAESRTGRARVSSTHFNIGREAPAFTRREIGECALRSDAASVRVLVSVQTRGSFRLPPRVLPPGCGTSSLCLALP